MVKRNDSFMEPSPKTHRFEEANVVYLPIPKLNEQQREHWQAQAAYWGVTEEHAAKALEVAQRGRENALRMLGMLAAERGLPDGA
jgi:hypothetical protein